MIAVEPGEYRLIVSVADSEGRIGSVTRAVTAWQMDGTGSPWAISSWERSRPEPRSNR